METYMEFHIKSHTSIPSTPQWVLLVPVFPGGEQKETACGRHSRFCPVEYLPTPGGRQLHKCGETLCRLAETN